MTDPALTGEESKVRKAKVTTPATNGDEFVEDDVLDEAVPAHAEREAARLEAFGTAAAPANEVNTPLGEPTSPVNRSDAQMHGADLYPLTTAKNPSPELNTMRVVIPDADLAAKEKKRKQYSDRAAKLGGFPASTIDAFNDQTLIFTTQNGGKYQINKKGTQLRHLAGPIPAGLRDEIEARRQERLEVAANR